MTKPPAWRLSRSAVAMAIAAAILASLDSCVDDVAPGHGDGIAAVASLVLLGLGFGAFVAWLASLTPRLGPPPIRRRQLTLASIWIVAAITGVSTAAHAPRRVAFWVSLPAMERWRLGGASAAVTRIGVFPVSHEPTPYGQPWPQPGFVVGHGGDFVCADVVTGFVHAAEPTSAETARAGFDRWGAVELRAMGDGWYWASTGSGCL